MSSLTKDILTLLSDNGFGIIGVDLFATHNVPPKPSTVFNIRLAGSAQPYSYATKTEYPLVKVVARTDRGEYQLCEDNIDRVSKFLSSVGKIDVNDSRFISIDHLDGPNDEGLDTNMRPSYSITVKCIRTTR